MLHLRSVSCALLNKLSSYNLILLYIEHCSLTELLSWLQTLILLLKAKLCKVLFIYFFTWQPPTASEWNLLSRYIWKAQIFLLQGHTRSLFISFINAPLALFVSVVSSCSAAKLWKHWAETSSRKCWRLGLLNRKTVTKHRNLLWLCTNSPLTTE